MKYFVTALWLSSLIVFNQTGLAHSLTTPLASKLERLEMQLQSQLEKVSHAREVADQSMDLAKIRIARELHRSEAEMERQIEILERLKEQIQNQAGDSPSSLIEITKAWNHEVQTAISGISRQIKTTSLLLRRLETFRKKVEDSSEENDSLDLRLPVLVPSVPTPTGMPDPIKPSPRLGRTKRASGTVPLPVPTPPSTCPFVRRWTVR